MVSVVAACRSVIRHTGCRGKRGLTPPQPQPIAASASLRPRAGSTGNRRFPSSQRAVARWRPRARYSHAPDGGQPARRCAVRKPIRLHSRREFRPIREKRSFDGGAVAVRLARAAATAERVAATARGRRRRGRLRCLRRATARRRPARARLSRGVAVSRPRCRRGWGGVRLLRGRGAVRSRSGVGLKGAVGSIRPRRLKHRSERCLRRATARRRLARRGLSRQAESEERRVCRGRSSRLGLSGCYRSQQQDPQPR